MDCKPGRRSFSVGNWLAFSQAIIWRKQASFILFFFGRGSTKRSFAMFKKCAFPLIKFADAPVYPARQIHRLLLRYFVNNSTPHTPGTGALPAIYRDWVLCTCKRHIMATPVPTAPSAPQENHTFTAGRVEIDAAKQDSTVRYTTIPLTSGGGMVSISASKITDTGQAKSISAMAPTAIEILSASHNDPKGLPLAVTIHQHDCDGKPIALNSDARHVIHTDTVHQMAHAVALPIGSGMPHQSATHIFHTLTDEQHAANVAVDSWPEGEVGGVNADGSLNEHSHATDIGEGLVSFPAKAPTKVAHVVRINDGNPAFLNGRGVKKVQPPGGDPLLVMKKDDLKTVTEIVQGKLKDNDHPLKNGVTMMLHHCPGYREFPDNHHAIVQWRFALQPPPAGVDPLTKVDHSALSAMLGGGGAADAEEASAYSKMTEEQRNAEIRKLAGAM